MLCFVTTLVIVDGTDGIVAQCDLILCLRYLFGSVIFHFVGGELLRVHDSLFSHELLQLLNFVDHLFLFLFLSLFLNLLKRHLGLVLCLCSCNGFRSHVDDKEGSHDSDKSGEECQHGIEITLARILTKGISTVGLVFAFKHEVNPFLV